MFFLSLASLLHLAWANCEAPNLIQLSLGRIDTVEKGENLHVKGGAVSLSAPEFSAFLPKLDVKMKPWTASTVDSTACVQMVQALQNTHPTSAFPRVIHTGILVPESDPTLSHWVEPARKLRLLPMSFLASQDLQYVKLYVWTNVEQTHPLIQEIFAPLLEPYGKYIEIKRFDASAEIKKVFNHYESNTESVSNLTGELVKIYKLQRRMDSKTDLMRVFLLYNYGGSWIDMDTVLVQSISPLLDEDWVSCQGPFSLNNNAMSSSKPQSKFMTAYLGHILSLGVELGFAVYGPKSLNQMARKIQWSVANSTFHALPRCFFDGIFLKGAHAADEKIPTDKDMFASIPMELVVQRRNYIDPRRKNHSTFALHFYHQWDQKVEDSSMANAAEKLYCELLNIKLK